MTERERRALVTLDIGDGLRAMTQVTHPLMRRYAERWSAEFVRITQARDPSQYVCFEKYQLADFFDDFERILYVDGDVLIAPDAPDIFARVPRDHVGGTDVSRVRTDFAADVRHAQEVMGEIGWRWMDGYLNAGIYVVSVEHRELMTPDTQRLGRWAQDPDARFSDQTLLNYDLQRLAIPFVDLGPRFNHTSIFGSRNRFRSWFIHYAGPGHGFGERVSQLERDAPVLENPLARTLHRQVPGYTWLRDRVVA